MGKKDKTVGGILLAPFPLPKAILQRKEGSLYSILTNPSLTRLNHMLTSYVRIISYLL